jgi:hypothetical protein
MRRMLVVHPTNRSTRGGSRTINLQNVLGSQKRVQVRGRVKTL